MNTADAASPRDVLDIIFANRNRAYGAYPLRREYARTMRRALGWSMLIIAFFIGLPHLLALLSTALPVKDATMIVYNMQPKPVIEIPPPPVPKTPLPPIRSTLAFRPPVVTKDEDVQEEVLPPDIDELSNTKADIGSITQAGDPDVQPTLDDLPEGPEKVVETSIPAKDDETYDMAGVQKPPTFPGGEREMFKFLAEHIKYPQLAREMGIEGRVALTFVINKDGSINDVELVKDIGGGCGKEALRVVNTMPRWSSGEANGQAVKVRLTLPVLFKLQ